MNIQEKEALSKKYIEYAKQYALDYCVTALEKVFEQEIKENEERKKKGLNNQFTHKEIKKIKKIDKEVQKQIEKEIKSGRVKVREEIDLTNDKVEE